MSDNFSKDLKREDLRKEVKYLKCFQNISYKEIAELLEIRPDSFYNYLNGQYELGYNKKQHLRFIINQLKE